MTIRLFDRRNRDRGASAIEYAAIIAISALIVGLLAALLPGRVAPSTKAAVCRLFQGDGCGSSGTPSSPGAGRPGSQNPGGQPPGGQGAGGNPQGNGGAPPADPDDPPKHEDSGLLGGLWKGTKTVFGELWHQTKDTGLSLWAMQRGAWCSVGLCIPKSGGNFWHQLTPEGIWKNFTDQWKTNLDTGWNLIKAPVVNPYNWGKQAWTDLQNGDYGSAAWNGFWAATPGGGLIRPMFFDQRFEENWANHRYTAAVTDVVFNVGTMFIPSPTKIGALGKLGKAGKAVGELSKAEKALADASKTAEAAEKAAKAGNLTKSRELLKELAEKNRKAREEARAAGCPIALPPPRRVPLGPLTGVPAAVTAPPFATFTLAPGLPGNAAHAPPASALVSQPAALPAAFPAAGPKKCDTDQKSLSNTRKALKAHLKGMGLTEQEAEALLASLQRAGGNKSTSLDDLLGALTDRKVPPDVDASIQATLKRLSETAATGRAGDAGLADVVKRMRDQLKAPHGQAEQIRNIRYEVENALSVIKNAPLEPGTKVALGGTERVDLGNGRSVDIRPIPDGDVVYVTGKGPPTVYHVDDTKATWAAVVGKIQKSRHQVEEMGEWAKQDPAHRQATYYVPPESKTNMADVIRNRTELEVMADNGVWLQVNGRRYSPRDLNKALEQNSFDNVPGQPGY